MEQQNEPKVIAKSKPDAAAAVSILHALGLWNEVSLQDRKSFIEEGKILDTPGGRILFNILVNCKPTVEEEFPEEKFADEEYDE